MAPRIDSALAGRRDAFEGWVPYARGGTRYIQAEYVPDLDGDGHVRGVVVLVTDLTARKREEEADSFLATAGSLHGYLVGMTISGLGFGMYMAVDLALAVDVLPATGSSAKDLGVLNIAGALPFALAPVFAQAVLALGGGSYTVLYVEAGACAALGALAITRVKGMR